MPINHKGPRLRSSNKYIRFIEAALPVIRSARIPLYSCKYSKKVYTQHQLLMLLLFKEYLREDYRDVVELVELTEDLREILELGEIPHFTTLQKFMTRIRSLYFDMILRRVISITAVDSSGLSSSC